MLSDTDATCIAIALALCNMLSDTDAACVVTALALCLKEKNKFCHWTKEWYKDRNTHTKILWQTEDWMNQTVKNFLQLDGPSFDELLEVVTSIAKRNTCEKQSLSGSICPLH